MITLETLRELPLLDSLDDDALCEIALVAADIHLVEGQWLIQEGEPPAFFLLVSGDVEISKMVAGHEQVLAQYHPGDYFGEVPLLLGSPAVANLRAMNAVRVLKLDDNDFHELMIRSEKVAATVLQTMTRRVANLQRISVETPLERTTVVGCLADVDCYDLRQFLSGNRLSFRWLDPTDPAAHAFIPPAAASGPYPVVLLADGSVLRHPGKREVAEQLGLHTAPSRTLYDVVIIGGGPAGLAAAVYGASEGLSTLMVEREAPGGQAGESSRIENYLGFPTGLSGDDLGGRALNQAKRFGAEVVVTRRAEAIRTEESPRQIVLDGGLAVSARTIVLATGVSWRSLAIPGAEGLVGRGLYYGAARTEAMGVRGKHAYLIGGGNSAGQAAMFFSDYASQVTLLIRASTIEVGMSQYLIAQLATRPNVEVRLNAVVAEVHGEGFLEGITVDDRITGERERCETSSVFVFIGADAETDWIPEQVARDERGFVLTGHEARASGLWALDRDPFLLETTVPCVFAAGDVRHGSIKRVASSVGEGSMAIAFIHQCLALTD